MSKAEQSIKDNETFFLRNNNYQVSPQGKIGDSVQFFVFTHVKHGHYSNPQTVLYPEEWTEARILAALLEDISNGFFDQ